MSITGSMYTGISGLQAQSQATSVVSNNLANASTTGFKSSSITFEDVFYSTVYAGGSVDQVGNGVAVSSINTNYSQGAYETTQSATDCAINGDGFFIVVDPDTTNTYYTRAGNFTLNTEGYLVDAHNNQVQGWAMEEGSPTGSLTSILLDGSQSPPSATTEASFSVNLNSTDEDNSSATNPYTALFSIYDGSADEALESSRYAYQTTITVYDENGASHDLTIYFDKVTTSDDDTIAWEYVVACDAGDDERTFNSTDISGTSAAGLLMTGTITFNTSGEVQSLTAFTLSDTPTTTSNAKSTDNWVLADFDANGFPIISANFTGADENQEIGLDLGISNSASTTGTGWDTSGGIDSLDDITDLTTPDELPSFNTTNVTTSAITSYTSSSATYSLYQDEYAAGTLIDVSVDENGVLSGSYTNGQTEELYTLALANFTNEQGLTAEGGNLYSATTESGQAVIGTPGTASFGTIASNALEQSNVDTATELTNLIIIQSTYQANSKIITTANTLLETAISLKR